MISNTFVAYDYLQIVKQPNTAVIDKGENPCLKQPNMAATDKGNISRIKQPDMAAIQKGDISSIKLSNMEAIEKGDIARIKQPNMANIDKKDIPRPFLERRLVVGKIFVYRSIYIHSYMIWNYNLLCMKQMHKTSILLGKLELIWNASGQQTK